MALNISRHSMPSILNGTVTPALVLPAAAPATALALTTVSGSIAGGCLLRLVPDEDVLMDCQLASGADPVAANGIKLFAGRDYVFRIDKAVKIVAAAA